MPVPIPPYTITQFVEEDNPRGMFPLNSTSLYITYGEKHINDYIYGEVLDPSKTGASFIPAPVCYSMKDAFHLRKLLGLDPISMYYMYDLVLRNAATHYQQSKPSPRRRYGYAFKRKRPLSPSDQYHDFRRAKYDLKSEYNYFAKVDISNCFNSFYHHSLVQHVEELLSPTDGAQVGQFLREINSGTSVNCFPQGIYPAKTIGNFYLSFIEESMELRSSAIIRFLDDIYFFSNEPNDVETDVVVLQQLIGQHSLHLNSKKTQFGSPDTDLDERKIDAVKKRLLRKREEAVGYDGEGDPEIDLEEAEKDYLEQIIDEDDVAEEDVELALSLIDETTTIVRLVELVCERYPQLIKHVHRLITTKTVEDEGACWELFSERVKRKDITEFELFWLSKIVVDRYLFNETSSDLLIKITKHPNATPFVKAVILESEHNGFGFLDLKISHLRSSPANITGIAALMGIRKAVKSKRNHVCGYVAKSGPHMNVYSEIVKAM
jgi:hypothetical protein